MLEIADHKPQVLQKCLEQTVNFYQQGRLKPIVGEVYKKGDVFSAHNDLEGGMTTGKLVVEW